MLAGRYLFEAMTKSKKPAVAPPRVQQSARHVGVAALFLLIAISLGTAGFMIIEGWTFLDSLYMTIISITTTGFSEVHPLSSAGRGLTVFIIMAGIASIAFLGGRIIQLLIEAYLLRRKKMVKRITRLKDHIILCGFGRMGRHIAEDLDEEKLPFVIIEGDETLAAELDDLGYLYIIGSASSDEILKLAGVERARGLISVVGTDAENVYTTLTAKSINPGCQVVARALTDESEPKLRTAGADRVIRPYELVARRIAQLVIRPTMVEFVETVATSHGTDITMEEITVNEGSPLAGVDLRQAPIRQKLNVIVVAIRRDGDLLYNPGPDEEVRAGDRLIAIGKTQQLKDLGELCGLPPG